MMTWEGTNLLLFFCMFSQVFNNVNIFKFHAHFVINTECLQMNTLLVYLFYCCVYIWQHISASCPLFMFTCVVIMKNCKSGKFCALNVLRVANNSLNCAWKVFDALLMGLPMIKAAVAHVLSMRRKSAWWKGRSGSVSDF